MGEMADYYDDRDDGEPLLITGYPGQGFAGRYYPDRILSPELHPRYGLPIQAVRGGIKYPKPKETHMTEPRMTKAQIEHELRINTELLDSLHKRRQDLAKKLKQAIPAEPHTFTMFTVTVRFKMRGKRYQYLILRNGSAYFTTGTKDGQKMFATWEALCDWLEGPDVYDHTDLEILSSAGNVVSFDSGAIERITIQQQPF